ncbi:MAG: S41 family peptidase [Epulopiscium sp.]|nr:S41 family peptidase [Candidatus Epulonipiscium sp.]
MEKKTYLKGFLSGVLAIILVAALARGIHRVQSFSGTELPRDTKIQTIEKYLDRYYVDEVDKEDMVEMMYAGLVAGVGDPYTAYMSKEELESFMEDTEGSFEGIGVEVTMDPKDNSLVVIAPIPNSPAEKVGILSGDKIIKVDGEDISGLNLNAIISRVKGEEGTIVKITVYREATNEILDFTVERKSIEVSSVTHRMLEDNIGYIKLSGFHANSYDQFKKAYDELTAQGMKGLILDVRNNPGGLLDIAVKIADELVPEGTIVYTVDKSGERKDSLSDEKHIEVPLILLVNGYSASASEVLAGAVQDMNVGKLVGTQTFGKGLVQGLFPLSDGSALKITIQKYYTPKGVCIQGEGITPDYIVELPEEYKYSVRIPEEEDTQLKKAVDVILEGLK